MQKKKNFEKFSEEFEEIGKRNGSVPPTNRDIDVHCHSRGILASYRSRSAQPSFNTDDCPNCIIRRPSSRRKRIVNKPLKEKTKEKISISEKPDSPQPEIEYKSNFEENDAEWPIWKSEAANQESSSRIEDINVTQNDPVMLHPLVHVQNPLQYWYFVPQYSPISPLQPLFASKKGKFVKLVVWKILHGQNTINSVFGDGTPLEELIEDLKQGKVTPSTLSKKRKKHPIRVVELGGFYYATNGNRMLFCFKQAGLNDEEIFVMLESFQEGNCYHEKVRGAIMYHGGHISAPRRQKSR